MILMIRGEFETHMSLRVGYKNWNSDPEETTPFTGILSLIYKLMTFIIIFAFLFCFQLTPKLENTEKTGVKEEIELSERENNEEKSLKKRKRAEDIDESENILESKSQTNYHRCGEFKNETPSKKIENSEKVKEIIVSKREFRSGLIIFGVMIEMFVGLVVVIYLETIDDAFNQRASFIMFLCALILLGFFYGFLAVEEVWSMFGMSWLGNDFEIISRIMEPFWKMKILNRLGLNNK